MKTVNIILFEWKHFVRSPFKVIAALLFMAAGIYGLHNGASLFQKQQEEIKKIEQKIDEQTSNVIAYYDKGQRGPADRPWVDVTTPFWAIWYVPTYHFKMPSTAMVYSIGQAEQYGFYKQITVWATPYDSDMAEEISNPERLQSGTLDFSFVILYLLPLLLFIFLYDLKSAESEQGFISLIEVQAASSTGWLIARMALYVIVLCVMLAVLLVYGAILTGVLTAATSAFGQLAGIISVYLFLWTIIYFLIVVRGKSIVSNTLLMIGVWILLVFIVPATVHQWVSLQHPVYLMTDLIDAQRDDREKLFSEPDSAIDARLFALFPEIVNSPVTHENEKRATARNLSLSALSNDLIQRVSMTMRNESSAKNDLIRRTYWFNPLTYFQNKINAIAQTHYIDYDSYRDEIQLRIDKRIEFMIMDIWNDQKVDKAKFLEYARELKR
jgi:ABC-2 type transport system permease protein